MRDFVRHKQTCRAHDESAERHRFACCGTDIANQHFHSGQRRGQQLVNRTGPLQHVNAKRRVRDALAQPRQHDQTGNDEGTLTDVVDVAHARTDGFAEHDEVQRSGEHRNCDALSV